MSRKSYYSSLPTTIQFSNGNKSSYAYDARGMKRSVQHAFSLSGIQIPFGADTVENTQSIQSFSQTDYCGNFIYEDAQLSRILTPEGYIETADSNGSIATAGNWRLTYFLKDHLGNVRARIAAPNFNSPIPSPPPSSPPSSPAYTLLDTTDYYPFGLEISTPEGLLTSGNNPYLYNGKQLDRMHGLNMYDYGWRQFDPQIGRWNTPDPMSELDYNFSPYTFCLNNPVNLLDPDGLSTHTDSTGRVIAVYNDKDNSVYKHSELPESYAQDNAGLKYKTEKDKDGKEKKVATNKLSGGEKMGETEYWNEFVSPETGKVLTETTIQFGKSFDPIISQMAAIAEGMDLKEIAANSAGGGLFDIKVKYNNVGGLLNGKYATSRSAGNYLAGYNAEGGTMFGIGISFTTFQKLAGALHIKESQGGTLSNKEKAGIVIRGTAYGPPLLMESRCISTG